MNAKKPVNKSKVEVESEQKNVKRARKVSEYGRQLSEKQKIKRLYGVLERQFRRFFALAEKMHGAPGQNLLSLLERRLDNTVFRLKFTGSRPQARQLVVHGHILVNGKRVNTPSYLVDEGDVVTLHGTVESKANFLDLVVDKRLQAAGKTPDWLEVDKKARVGRVLRLPVRSDILTPIEEHLVVELYSK